MISYLKGKLIRNSIDYIVVEVQGVGYKVYISGSLERKLPQIGQLLELHTYNYVREDNISLYGFSSVEELGLFEQLLGVSKIGPKVALSILTNMSVREFKLAIVNNEIEVLKKVKGIGSKTAKRLILELQEKVEIDNIVGDADISIKSNKLDDAIEALVSLGYKQSTVRPIVMKIFQKDNELTVEEIIKESLASLS